MNKTGDTRITNLWFVLIAGSLWGMMEATAGVALRGSCARLLSGSLLMGGMMFFGAFTFAGTRKKWLVLVLPLFAAAFKLYSALLLSLPIISGAIINPIYAFITEAIALFAILVILNPALLEKMYGRVILGGMSALLAANFFPAVRLFTGIPACVLPGTKFPLALWGAPVAVLVSMVTVPAGFLLADALSRVRVPSPALRRHGAWACSMLLVCGCFWVMFLLYR